MGILFAEYKNLFKNKYYRKSFYCGILILLLAGISSSLAFSYADIRKGSYLNDLLLDNLPTIHLLFLSVFLPALAVTITLILLIKNPRRIPASLKSIGLLYIIRAFFITLTNLKSRPEKIILTQAYGLSKYLPYKGNDLFFSGHVAFPIIVALLFWDKKKLRNLMILLSILSGAVMIFSKAHYSIDIFAAPFMAYAIFKLSERVFAKDFNALKKPKL